MSPPASRRTETRYTTTAVVLHWLIALLFLGSYAAIYYRHWFTTRQTPENFTALQVHLAIGISIGALVLLRVLWRLTHTPPTPVAGPAWQQRAAHWGHRLLYTVMIIMPITGYLGTGVPTEYLGIPKFADTALFDWLVTNQLGLTFKEFEKPIDFIHKRGGEYLVWVLILGHIVAALFHQFHLKDGTMQRMSLTRE